MPRRAWPPESVWYPSSWPLLLIVVRTSSRSRQTAVLGSPGRQAGDVQPGSPGERLGDDPDKAKVQAEGQGQGHPHQAGRPRGATHPASTWAGRSPTSCRGRGSTGSFARRASRKSSPKPCSTRSKIPKGATVADVGAGAGYHSIRLAQASRPQGNGAGQRLAAGDADDAPAQRARGQGHEHQAHPRHPARHQAPRGAVDLILMVDVYHECTEPRDHASRALEGVEAQRTARAGRVPRRGRERSRSSPSTR